MIRFVRPAGRMALIAALSFALGGCGTARTAETGSNQAVEAAETLDAGTLAARIARGDVLLIDVRTPEEFSGGRIAGAINIPLDRLNPASLPQQPGKETILYCRSDRRSGLAARQVAAAGGPALRHLDGGIIAWEASGLPVAD